MPQVWPTPAAAGASVKQGGCLGTLVPAGGTPAGMLKLCHIQAQEPCSPTPSAHCTVLLFGSNPPLIFQWEQIYEQSFALYPLPLCFSGFPATAVTACSEMQVIRLMPASFAWWSRIRKLIWQSTCKLYPIFLQGLRYLVLEMLSLGSR